MNYQTNSSENDKIYPNFIRREMIMHRYYVYIMSSPTGMLYTGMTNDLIRRVYQHQQRMINGYTKEHNINRLIYYEETENVIEAIFRMLNLVNDHFRKMSPAFQMDIKNWQKKLLEYPKEIETLPYYSNNSEILVRGIKEGVFRDDIDVEITNKCLLEVVRMSNDKDIFPPEDFVEKDIIRNFYINYLRGLSTQKGLDLINHYERILAI